MVVYNNKLTPGLTYRVGVCTEIQESQERVSIVGSSSIRDTHKCLRQPHVGRRWNELETWTYTDNSGSAKEKRRFTGSIQEGKEGDYLGKVKVYQKSTLQRALFKL